MGAEAIITLRDLKLPRGCILRCNERGHRTAPDTSGVGPLRCGTCGSTNVLWEHGKKPWLRVNAPPLPPRRNGRMGVDRPDWTWFANRFLTSIWTGFEKQEVSA